MPFSSQSPRRVRQLVGQCRTNVQLMERSDLVSSHDLALAKAQFESALSEDWALSASPKSSHSYLINRDFIFPTSMDRIGLGPDVKLSLKKQLLNVPEYEAARRSDFSEKLDMRFQRSAEENRVSSLEWRIEQWLNEVTEKGWFPFFVTLTIDPAKAARWYRRRYFGPHLRLGDGRDHAADYWADPANFQRVVHGFERVVRDALKERYPGREKEFSKRNCPGPELVQYVAVVEHGASRVHHHSHMIVALRDVPRSALRDPQVTGRRDRRSCGVLSAAVANAHGHGFVDVQYARYFGDVWSKIGHVWPIGHRDLPDELGGGRVPIRIGPPGALANYLSKYLQKDNKEFSHRVRARQGLGVTGLRRELGKLRDSQLASLAMRPRRYETAVNVGSMHGVPLDLVRDEAARLLWFRRWRRGDDMVDESDAKQSVYTALVRSEDDLSIDPLRASPSEFYSLVTSVTEAPTGYTSDRIRNAHTRLSRRFRPVSHSAVNGTRLSRERLHVDAGKPWCE